MRKMKKAKKTNFLIGNIMWNNVGLFQLFPKSKNRSQCYMNQENCRERKFSPQLFPERTLNDDSTVFKFMLKTNYYLISSVVLPNIVVKTFSEEKMKIFQKPQPPKILMETLPQVISNFSKCEGSRWKRRGKRNGRLGLFRKNSERGSRRWFFKSSLIWGRKNFTKTNILFWKHRWNI